MRGRLPCNVMHFARLLRGAGLPIGPGRVCDGIEALGAVGLERRDDVYWALHAVFVSRREHHELYDEAFALFWKNPNAPENVLSLLLPKVSRPAAPQPPAVRRRLAEQLQQPPISRPPAEDEGEAQVEASFTWSNLERLETRDFEEMSRAELDAAKALIARLVLPFERVTTRRYVPSKGGGVFDAPATLRGTLRGDPDVIRISFKRRRRRRPPLVVLCDISGSMSRYSRMLLHFVHALTSDRDRVQTFVFGTRLTNITRQLRHRDPDVALDRVGETVTDWAGGTRIGVCLETFNRRWSRRVLAQGAVVLLITDGLDRDDGAGLSAQAARLARSARRLIWLNPLLRFDGFEPKASGIRALLPWVDELRAAHDIRSLRRLAQVLSAPSARIRSAAPSFRRGA